MLQMAVSILIPRLSSRYSCNIFYISLREVVTREWICIHHKKWRNMKCLLYTGYILGKGIKTVGFGPVYFFFGWVLMRQGWLITGSCRDAGHQYGKLNPWAVGSSELASESESNFVTTEKKTSCDFALWKVNTFEALSNSFNLFLYVNENMVCPRMLMSFLNIFFEEIWRFQQSIKEVVLSREVLTPPLYWFVVIDNLRY